MYQPYAHEENQLLLPSEFFLPFGGRLNLDNRWIKLAQMIPWARVDHKYAKSFKKSFRGQKAISVRMALGALIIQERLQQSDQETVETIVEKKHAVRTCLSSSNAESAIGRSAGESGSNLHFIKRDLRIH